MRERLERKIIGTCLKLENAKTFEDGKKVINEGNVNSLLERIKPIDEVSYNELKARYFDAVKANSEKK